VILQTHGGGSARGGNFSIVDEDWTLSVASYAYASGACAYATPVINSSVSREQEQNLDISGSATATAQRDSYWGWPWVWNGEKTNTDSGDIYARLKVVWAKFTRIKESGGWKLKISVNGKIKKIIDIGLGFEYSSGGEETEISEWYDWKVLDDEVQGRSASVSGPDTVSKSSGANGDFQGWDFESSAAYP